MSEPIETREVGAELVPASQEDRVYRPALVLAPDEAQELVAQILELQRSVLRPGVDYMVIPRTPKPSLLKPGAERLLQFFGLGHHMELLETDHNEAGKAVGFFYRCTVTKMMADGREVTVSSCDGYCGRDEQKWRDAPLNTILKMAQKRALVGACLTATATSGLFTQDLEDMTPQQRENRQRAQAPRGQRVEHDAGEARFEGPPPQEDGPAPRMVTRAQQTKMILMFNERGVTERADRLRLVMDVIGRQVESSTELTFDEAHQLIEWLEKNKEAT